MPATAASGAEGARRVLAILQAFSPRQHTRTARDLAGATGIPLPSMYRYIALLRETGLLVSDDRGAYRLSARLISMARAAEAAESLIAIADPVMRDLAHESGMPVILVRLIAQVPVCVHQAGSPQPALAAFEPGQPLPLERGASGQMLLAGLPEIARKEHLAALTRTDPAAAARLETSVTEIAGRGWASGGEGAGGDAWAVSAAVTDGRSAVAALTAVSPLAGAPAVAQERLTGQVMAAAATLSRLIADTKRL